MNVRPGAINLLEENTDNKLLDIWLGDNITKSKGNQTKMNKRDYIKLKSVCTGKETTNEMWRQHMEWEKIFANHISDKGLVSKLCKELVRLNNANNKKTKTHNLLQHGQKI